MITKMRHYDGKLVLNRLAVILLVVSAGLLLPSSGRSQGRERSSAELIESLIHSNPETTGSVRVFTCGQTDRDRQERATVGAIVRLGKTAIPNIERVFDSLEKQGKQSRFAPKARWFPLIYARILGPSASPRLLGMLHNSKIAFLQLSLDYAVALSLGLTSYVSALREPGGIAICRSQQPREPLDQLILSWEQNDRTRLEKSLGPHAKDALESLLKDKSWESIRSELWKGSADQVAVGYVFDVRGRWSEPEETLEEKSGSLAAGQDLTNPQIETLFKDRSGNDCGKRSVTFLGITRGTVTGGMRPRPNTYLIDNSDLKDLLTVITSCAAQTER